MAKTWGPYARLHNRVQLVKWTSDGIPECQIRMQNPLRNMPWRFSSALPLHCNNAVLMNLQIQASIGCSGALRSPDVKAKESMWAPGFASGVVKFATSKIPCNLPLQALACLDLIQQENCAPVKRQSTLIHTYAVRHSCLPMRPLLSAPSSIIHLPEVQFGSQSIALNMTDTQEYYAYAQPVLRDKNTASNVGSVSAAQAAASGKI